MKAIMLFLLAASLFLMPFALAFISNRIDPVTDVGNPFFVWDWQLEVGFVLAPLPSWLTKIILGVSLILTIVGFYKYAQRDEELLQPKPHSIAPSRLTKVLGIVVLVVAAFGFVGYVALVFPGIITSFVGKTARLPLLHNLVVGILVLLGSSGLLLIYQSYKRRSRLKLIVGFFVVFFMFVLLEMLFWLTLSWMR